MKLGNLDIAALKVGTVNASKAYLGSTLVWEAGGTPPTVGYGITATASIFTAGTNQQRGWKFLKVGTHNCLGARVHVTNAGEAHTLRLWRVTDQALLASVEVTTVANDWSEGFFDAPVSLVDGLEYIITTRTTSGAVYTENAVTAANATLNPKLSTPRFSGLLGDTYPGFTTTQHLRGLADVILEGS
ncbi:MAG: DUF4082 domain-containing protein [Trueperaceae bacterium]